MNDIDIDGKKYISSKQAALITGYAKDYVGQLCREGRVPARLIGRSWYVLESALQDHRYGTPKTTEKPTESIGEEKVIIARSETWEMPRYQPEAQNYFPSINKLAEEHPAVRRDEAPQAILGVIEEEKNAMSIEMMHGAWKEWFSRKDSPEEVSTEEANHQNREGRVEMPHELALGIEEGEIPVPIYHYQHTISSFEEERAYMAPSSPPATGFLRERKEVVSSTINDRNNGSFLIFRSLLLIVIVAAIFVGILGSGIVNSSISSKRYINFISGTSLYTTSK